MKRGFTLIELLGVIILLGVIAVIAVPIVKDAIDLSKESSLEKQEKVILESAKNWATHNTVLLPAGAGTILVRIDTLKQAGFLENKEIINPVTKEEMKGCAKITYNTDFNQYEYEYDEECNAYNDIISSSDNCIKNGTCAAGTEVSVQVNDKEKYSFYVINDNGEELTLIMDRNLGDNVVWVNESDYNSSITNGMSNDTSASNSLSNALYNPNNKVIANQMFALNCFLRTDKGPLTALKALESRTANWTNIPFYSYTLEDDNDVLGGDNIYSKIERKNIRARMPKVSEFVPLCSSEKCPEYLYTNTFGNNNTSGYWFSTAVSFDFITAWVMENNITYGNICQGDYFGIRPVIQLSKFAPVY